MSWLASTASFRWTCERLLSVNFCMAKRVRPSHVHGARVSTVQYNLNQVHCLL